MCGKSTSVAYIMKIIYAFRATFCASIGKGKIDTDVINLKMVIQVMIENLQRCE